MEMSDKNPINELIINIIIPILVLNKAGKYLGDNGQTYALIIALLIPAIYMVMDFIKFKKPNFISILGFVSILLTGGIALLQLEGFWFAVKEAAIPALIGVVVFISAFTKKPLMRLLFNESIMKMDLIEQRLEEQNTKPQFNQHVKKSTVLFSLSFFFSAILNYVLAMRIFQPIDEALPELTRTEILNEQIADMTWQGYIVIMIPSLVIMAALMWYLFKGIKELTGLGMNDVIKEKN